MLKSNHHVEYGGEMIRVDALAERIDTTEREVDGETYNIWTKKLNVSKLGEKKILISEKVTDDEDEENPVKYLVMNKIDAPTTQLIRVLDALAHRDVLQGQQAGPGLRGLRGRA